MLEGSDYPELFSPGGCIKKDLGGACAMSPRLYQQAYSTDNIVFFRSDKNHLNKSLMKLLQKITCLSYPVGH
jgi:hypothetical protein